LITLTDVQRKFTFFLDRNHGDLIRAKLSEFGFKVKACSRIFPKDMPDVEWIAECAKQNWVILSGDKSIEEVPEERQAVIDGKCKVFMFDDSNSKAEEWIAAILVGRLRIMHLVENSDGPFFVTQLELQRSLDLTETVRGVVEGYNEDDCRATECHRQWLESLRSDLIARGKAVPRPAPKESAPSEELTAYVRRVTALFDALTRDLPAEPKDRSSSQAARWLLAHALDWHRREEKVKWWEYYRLREMPEEELYDEKAAVVGLAHQQRMPKANPKERAPVDRYTYPPQECAIREGDTLADRRPDGNALQMG
jgi:PIN like domain